MLSNPLVSSNAGVLVVLPTRLPQGEFTLDGGRRIEAGDRTAGERDPMPFRLRVDRGAKAGDLTKLTELSDPFDPRLLLAG
jgi:hypothetical protein